MAYVYVPELEKEKIIQIALGSYPDSSMLIALTNTGRIFGVSDSNHEGKWKEIVLPKLNDN